MRLFFSFLALALLASGFRLHADVPSSQSFGECHADKKKWLCESKGIVRLNEDKKGGVADFPQMCYHDVVCKSLTGAEPIPFVIGCQVEDGACPEFERCAERRFNDNTALGRAKHSANAPTAEEKRKFGESCQYTTIGVGAVYRQHNKKSEEWETICLSPVQNCTMPENSKGSFAAACPYESFKTEMIEGKRKNTVVCPPAPTCLANAIPLRPGLTKAQEEKLRGRGEAEGGAERKTGGSGRSH